MRILPGTVLVTVAVSCLAPGASAAAVRRSDPVLVRAVPSGEALQIAGMGRVRLAGITVPRTGAGPRTGGRYASEARERLASLVLHRYVRLEWDDEPRGEGRGAAQDRGPRAGLRSPRRGRSGDGEPARGRGGTPARSRVGAAYVMLEEGTFVNAWLLRQGLARLSARGPLSRRTELERAEAEARRARRGVWAASGRSSGSGQEL